MNKNIDMSSSKAYPTETLNENHLKNFRFNQICNCCVPFGFCRGKHGFRKKIAKKELFVYSEVITFERYKLLSRKQNNPMNNFGARYQIYQDHVKFELMQNRSGSEMYLFLT